MNWGGEDYLLSYAKSGNSDYKKIAEVKARTGITITNLVRIFGGFYIGSNNWKNFKKGTFEIKNEEEANDFIDAYYILKSFIPRRVWNNGQFVIALKKMLDEVSIEEFLVKLNSWGQSMELRTAKKEYLRDMETIINYNNRGEYRRLSF